MWSWLTNTPPEEESTPFLADANNQDEVSQREDAFANCPPEIMREIISYLPIEDRCNLLKTSKNMKEIVEKIPTEYLVATKEGKIKGTYRQIVDVFNKRKKIEQTIEKTDLSSPVQCLTSTGCAAAMGVGGAMIVGGGIGAGGLVATQAMGSAVGGSCGSVISGCGMVFSFFGAFIGCIAGGGSAADRHALFTNWLHKKVEEKRGEMRKDMDRQYPKPMLMLE